MESLINMICGTNIYIIALVSLLWFLLGVLLGNRMPRRQGFVRQSHGRQGGADRNEGRDGKRQPSQYELYVGNLPYEMDDDGLKKMIDPCGSVLSARIITNRISGASKGYGFVKMAGAEDVKTAIESLNNKEIEGRRVSVSEARTRPRGRRG
ncbi:MAG: hypothetical protein WCL44_09280 [bacterium]